MLAQRLQLHRELWELYCLEEVNHYKSSSQWGFLRSEISWFLQDQVHPSPGDRLTTVLGQKINCHTHWTCFQHWYKSQQASQLPTKIKLCKSQQSSTEQRQMQITISSFHFNKPQQSPLFVILTTKVVYICPKSVGGFPGGHNSQSVTCCQVHVHTCLLRNILHSICHNKGKFQKKKENISCKPHANKTGIVPKLQFCAWQLSMRLTNQFLHFSDFKPELIWDSAFICWQKTGFAFRWKWNTNGWKRMCVAPKYVQMWHSKLNEHFRSIVSVVWTHTHTRKKSSLLWFVCLCVHVYAWVCVKWEFEFYVSVCRWEWENLGNPNEWYSCNYVQRCDKKLWLFGVGILPDLSDHLPIYVVGQALHPLSSCSQISCVLDMGGRRIIHSWSYELP